MINYYRIWDFSLWTKSSSEEDIFMWDSLLLWVRKEPTISASTLILLSLPPELISWWRYYSISIASLFHIFISLLTWKNESFPDTFISFPWYFWSLHLFVIFLTHLPFSFLVDDSFHLLTPCISNVRAYVIATFIFLGPLRVQVLLRPETYEDDMVESKHSTI
jgi:hypothetical protein